MSEKTSDTDFSLGTANPFGKLTAPVKTDIAESTDELLTMLASASRKTKAEYVRNLIIEHVHGKAEIVRLHVDPSFRSSR